MNNTDSIEIDSLLNGAKEMANFAKKTNEKFVDQSILKFATEARDNYLENKEYLKKIVRENLPLFFNLDNFEVSTSGACCDGYYAMRGEKFTYGIGGGVFVVLRLTDATTIANNGYRITFKVRSMEVLNIWYHTSDTDDDRYRICSAWDLVDQPSDKEAKMPYECQKTPAEWKKLYGLATWTRAKNQLLVNQFKIALREITASKKSVADSNENNMKYIGSVKAYIKIQF